MQKSKLCSIRIAEYELRAGFLQTNAQRVNAIDLVADERNAPHLLKKPVQRFRPDLLSEEQSKRLRELIGGSGRFLQSFAKPSGPDRKRESRQARSLPCPVQLCCVDPIQAVVP
jgi:hypothetical protein